MYKEAWCTYVSRNKLIAFLTFWLPSQSSLLKLPNKPVEICIARVISITNCYCLESLMGAHIFLACVADVILPQLVTSAKQPRYPCYGPSMDSIYRKRVSNFPSTGLALLTGQSWPVFKSWYTGGGPEQDFGYERPYHSKVMGVLDWWSRSPLAFWLRFSIGVWEWRSLRSKLSFD